MAEQKIEFQESQLAEAHMQHDETKKSHSTLMKAFENIEKKAGNSVQKSEQEIEILRATHVSELRKIESEHEVSTQRLTEQVESLQSKNNELETHLKTQLVDQSKANEELSAELESVSHQLKSAEEELAKTENSWIGLIEEAETVSYTHLTLPTIYSV